LTRQMLTPKEVAQHFHVCRRTLWRWVKAGTFPPPVSVNGRVKRWPREVLDWKSQPVPPGPGSTAP
jgi:predicted DNA-binding transcriptional regulator AlpA